MPKRKPDSTDAMIAQWRAAGLDVVEGKPATLPEIAPQTANTEAHGECVVPHTRRKSKYGAVKTEVDGIVFDSKKEARRYLELKTMEKAGVISALELQPSFDLVVNGVKIGKYKGDFRYVVNGTYVVEDCKGMKTPVYRLKKKLMLALHSITILET